MASYPDVLPRLLLAVLAIAIAALLAQSARSYDACQEARTAVIAAATGAAAASTQEPAVRGIRAHCRG